MRKISAFLASLALIPLIFACGDKQNGAKGPQKRPPAPVVTAKAKIMDFPVELTQMGTVEADQTTPVKAQVGGAIVSVLIRDGQMVTAGQELFRIDSRTIEGNIRQLEAERERLDAQARTVEAQITTGEAQARTAAAQAKTAAAQVGAAESNVKTLQAQSDLADAQVKRYQGLVEKDFVTREQYDQVRTAAEAAKSNLASAGSQAEAAKASAEASKSNAEAAKANVEAIRASLGALKASKTSTEAAIENAKIQLGYTTIRSPISGQAGNLPVNIGDYVKGNGDTTLVVINQINPILVRFAIPETVLPEVMTYRKEGSLKVTVEVPGGDSRVGTLNFVDNTVDRATGTITLKASFENADGKLWPGQFAKIKLLLHTRPEVVAVPSAAIQVGQKGPYVYLVGGDSVAQLKLVRPGLSRDEVTIVEDGLKDGDVVIIDGHLKVAPGAMVVEKPAPGSPAQGQAQPGKPEGAQK